MICRGGCGSTGIRSEPRLWSDHCIALVHVEHDPQVDAALTWEKQLTGWRRAKHRALIEAENPRWEDLSGVWAWPG